jgi:nucleotide-binding universal stress UspA family protein
MYNKILVPLDGSHRAELILPHAEDLAKRYHATLILLQIVELEPMTVAVEPVYTGIDPQQYQHRVEAAQAYLKARQDDLLRKGINAEIIAGDGPVVPEIIATAEREGVDLIAMVSHGRTGLARVFYGSGAAGVLHQVDRPLLLIRALDNA